MHTGNMLLMPGSLLGVGVDDRQHLASPHGQSQELGVDIDVYTIQEKEKYLVCTVTGGRWRQDSQGGSVPAGAAPAARCPSPSSGIRRCCSCQHPGCC